MMSAHKSRDLEDMIGVSLDEYHALPDEEQLVLLSWAWNVLDQKMAAIDDVLTGLDPVLLSLEGGAV